jgi:SHS2 domain-containing protein
MPNKPYQLIEHTADVGIKVKGKTINELFKNAALAMFDIIAEESAPKVEETKKIILKLKAEQLDELLVSWLNELLSLSAVKELIFFGFKINSLEENSLDAELMGKSSLNYRINTEIKAATYHELEVKKISSGWQAKVIFDV